MKKDDQSGIKNKKRVALLILIMAACLFMNSFFKTRAAEQLPSMLLYPLSQGAALILSTFMSVIFFKERLNAKAVVGITIAFVGLIFINVL